MIQSIIDFLYRSPKSKIKTFNRFGGYFNYQRMIKNSKIMENESANLSPITSYPMGRHIYFLTGVKYLYQTLFCIHSLTKVSNIKFKFILVDDGSLNKKLIEYIHLQLPGVEVIQHYVIEQNLHQYLPLNKFPYLHHKRKVYPHIKKLTDIHTIPGNPWKLVLDSDMLFWKEPKEIIDWLNNPDRPLHMVDCDESYGYTTALMENLCNSKIKILINVGAIGLNSDQINWESIEHWIQVLEEKEGTSYYLEQALSAMLIGCSNSVVLNSKDYIVNPNNEMISNKSGTLHHYVDMSKEGYFKLAWKNCIQ